MSTSTAGTYTVAIGVAGGSTIVSVPMKLTTYTPTDSGGSTGGGGGGGACGLLAPVALALVAFRRRRA